jgi:hypothetical protein
VDNGSITPTFGNYIIESLRAVSISRVLAPLGATMVSGGWVSNWAPPVQRVPRFTPLLEKGFTVFAVRHGSSPRYVSIRVSHVAFG